MKAIEFINSLSTITNDHENSYLPLFEMPDNEILTLLDTHINGKNVIHIAAEYGHTHCIVILVKKYGLSVNKPTLTGSEDRTPLYFACYNNHHDTVAHLLILGAEMICEFHTYRSALEVAVERNDKKTLEVLLNQSYIKQSYSISNEDPYFFKYTLLSVEGRFSKCLAEFVNLQKFYSQLLGMQGQTPPLTIFKALKMNNVDVLLYLLTQTKINNINIVDENYYTPLINAVLSKSSNENAACIALLLQFPGINLNQMTPSGKTAMELAVQLKNTEAVWLLQQKMLANENILPPFNITSSQTTNKTDSTFVLNEKKNLKNQNKLQYHYISLSERLANARKVLDEFESHTDLIKTTNQESLLMIDENNNNDDYSDIKEIGCFLFMLFDIYQNTFGEEPSENEVLKEYNSLSLRAKKFLIYFKTLYDLTAFHLVTSLGYTHLLKRLLNEIPEHSRNSVINCRDNDGNTILDYAFIEQHKEIIQLLLKDKNLDLMNQEVHRVRTLSKAIETGKLEFVKLLVEEMLVRGISLDQVCNQDELTALMYAAHFNASDIVDYLLEKNVSVTLTDSKGKMADSLSTNPDIQYRIFSHFFNQFSLNQSQIKELQNTLGGLYSLDTLTLERLTSKGISLAISENIMKKIRETITFDVVIEDTIEQEKPYEKISSHVVGTAEDILREIAYFLEVAKMSYHIEESDYYQYCSSVINQFFMMLSPQTKIVIITSQFLQTLNYKLYTDNIECFLSNHLEDYSFKSLQTCHELSISYLEQQKDLSFINQTGHQNETLLFNAVYHQEISFIKKLLEKGIKIDKTNNEGISALGYACIWNKTESAKILIDYQANINQLTKNKITPLMIAARNNNLHIIKKLLSRKDIDINIQSKKGFTALHYAIAKRNIESAMYFLQNQDIKVNTMTDIKESPLHTAIKIGSAMIVKKLIEAGADLHCKNKDGFTPLMFATYLKEQECIEVLTGTSEKSSKRKESEKDTSKYSEDEQNHTKKSKHDESIETTKNRYCQFQQPSTTSTATTTSTSLDSSENLNASVRSLP